MATAYLHRQSNGKPYNNNEKNIRTSWHYFLPGVNWNKTTCWPEYFEKPSPWASENRLKDDIFQVLKFVKPTVAPLIYRLTDWAKQPVNCSTYPRSSIRSDWLSRTLEFYTHVLWTCGRYSGIVLIWNRGVAKRQLTIASLWQCLLSFQLNTTASTHAFLEKRVGYSKVCATLINKSRNMVTITTLRPTVLKQ